MSVEKQSLSNMPYYTKKEGDKTCVYKKDGGKKVGCTSGPVNKYLGALHANANEGINEDTRLSAPLKISGLVKRLLEIKKEHGDVPVKLVDGETGNHDSVNGVYTSYPIAANRQSLDRTKPVDGAVITKHMHEKSLQETLTSIVREVIKEQIRTKN
jgi:hypothetical protein